MTTATIEETVDATHRDVVAALKATLKSYAESQASNKRAHKEDQREGRYVSYDDLSIDITVLHIVHNRLRHKRPHTSSVERDDVFIHYYLTRGRLNFLEPEQIDYVMTEVTNE